MWELTFIIHSLTQCLTHTNWILNNLPQPESLLTQCCLTGFPADRQPGSEADFSPVHKKCIQIATAQIQIRIFTLGS